MAKLKSLGGIVALAIAVFIYYSQGEPQTGAPDPGFERDLGDRGVSAVEPARPDADQLLADAFANQTSNVMAEGQGTVVRVLSDDNEGDRHQRFVLRLASGQTVLVAHNIDLADRINGIEAGDQVNFKGEYEWNAQGGVLHWTHHDPVGRHPGGWLRHRGRTYQ